MTFEKFQLEMITVAKEIQGENYAGDEYYLQRDCWLEHFDDGDTPRDTVLSDMEAWD